MNKPVGRYYWESVVDGHFMAIPSEGTIHYEIDDFPLYLYPAELTDEFAEKHYQRGYLHGLSKAERMIKEFKDKEEVDFVRKAQEK